MKAGIIIPIRDSFNTGERFQELDRLQMRIKEICDKNNQDYQISIIYQDDDQLFNKASLMNIGVNLVQNECDYFIFHDVDNIPVGYYNVYMPREYSGVLVRLWDGELIRDIDEHFAGALYFKKEDFFNINGFSNYYWGWGWETTTTPIRLRNKGIFWKRYDGEFIQMVHETKHRYLGNPNLINNVIVYRQLDLKLWEGYSDVKFSLTRSEFWGEKSTIYYVKLAPPQYDITRYITPDEIIKLVGECDEKEYQWILETYK